MTIDLTIRVLAALSLLWSACAIATYNTRAVIMLQFIPAILAAALGFFALAEYMGWPV